VSSDSAIEERVRAEVAAAANLEDLGAVARTAARRLVSSDGATFVLKDGDRCFYADEDAIAPLWKGQRFPIDECISGWSMRNGEPAVVPDISTDERIPLAAYRPTFVRSLVMVPVGAPATAAIGAYWATEAQHADAVPALVALAGLVATRLDEIGLADAPWAPNFRAGDVRA
jgi:GAF domain-containing protein